MTLRPATAATATMQRGSAWEVLLVFLRLGLTSFGGPVAHLATFARNSSAGGAGCYADLVALCQFLPGPGSSQVGIAIRLFRHRHGYFREMSYRPLKKHCDNS
jgi:chromate transporter